jgi:DEAD/DEAH box helicase domain-containing protein
VRCAAFELPFTTVEQYGHAADGSGVDVQQVLGVLEESGLVHRTGGDAGGDGVWQWTNESYPADAVSLRSISSDNFVVVDTTDGANVIGETSFTSGPSTLHEKAIYLVEAVLFQVEKLDFDGRKAYVRRIDCDYYTDAITYTKVTVLDTFASGPGPASHGEVHVSSRVVGF